MVDKAGEEESNQGLTFLPHLFSDPETPSRIGRKELIQVTDTLRHIPRFTPPCRALEQFQAPGREGGKVGGGGGENGDLWTVVIHDVPCAEQAVLAQLDLFPARF